MFGIWNKVSITILNKDLAFASVQETNENTEHARYHSWYGSVDFRDISRWLILWICIGCTKKYGFKSFSGQKAIVKAWTKKPFWTSSLSRNKYSLNLSLRIQCLLLGISRRRSKISLFHQQDHDETAAVWYCCGAGQGERSQSHLWIKSRWLILFLLDTGIWRKMT